MKLHEDLFVNQTICAMMMKVRFQTLLEDTLSTNMTNTLPQSTWHPHKSEQCMQSWITMTITRPGIFHWQLKWFLWLKWESAQVLRKHVQASYCLGINMVSCLTWTQSGVHGNCVLLFFRLESLIVRQCFQELDCAWKGSWRYQVPLSAHMGMLQEEIGRKCRHQGQALESPVIVGVCTRHILHLTDVFRGWTGWHTDALCKPLVPHIGQFKWI